MSFEHQALAINHSQATGAARAILVGIASMANDEGEAFPGMMKLAQYGGYTGYAADWEDYVDAAAGETDDERIRTAKALAKADRDKARRSAMKAIKRLEELGEIEVITNGGGTRYKADHMRPNLYRITLVCPPRCDHSAMHRILTREEMRARIAGGFQSAQPVDNTAKEGEAHRPGGGLQARYPEAHRPPESSVNNKPTNENTNGTLPTAQDADVSDFELLAPDTVDEADEVDADEVVEKARQRFTEQQERSAQAASRPARPAPAPRYTRYTPPPPRAADPPRPPEYTAAARVVERERCPDGFGTGASSRHWLPGELTGCARCGADALDLLHQIESRTENTP